jgi:hypothetical protein
MKRILLGFVGCFLAVLVTILAEKDILVYTFPPQVYATVINLNLTLMYFVMDASVMAFVKRHVDSMPSCLRVIFRGNAVNPVNG